MIGNPPYVFARDAHFDDNFKRAIADSYFSKLTNTNDGKQTKANQSGKINLFALFILHGIFELRAKGVLSFVIPNNILRTTIYDTIRKYMLENTSINQIVDLGSGVFQKVTASTVTLLLTKKISDDNQINAITDIVDLSKQIYTTNTIAQSQFLENTSYAFNIFGNSENNIVLKAIEKNSSLFGNYCIDIIEGIVAKKTLIFTEPGDNRFPLLEGKSIKKYTIIGINKWIEWNKSEIHRARPDYLWQEDEKLVTQRISGGYHPIIVAYDNSKYKTFASTNCIVLKDDYKHLYKFFLALLNSNTLNWYYANNFSNNSKLTVNISKTYLEQLPIPNTTSAQQQPIIDLVDSILSAKRTNPQADTSADEKEIDRLVYELYGLTDEKIKIIEEK